MIKIIIANIPNSKPLNGNVAKNPPSPKIPSKPNAQEGQAGAKILTRTLEVLA